MLNPCAGSHDRCAKAVTETSALARVAVGTRANVAAAIRGDKPIDGRRRDATAEFRAIDPPVHLDEFTIARLAHALAFRLANILVQLPIVMQRDYDHTNSTRWW